MSLFLFMLLFFLGYVCIIKELKIKNIQSFFKILFVVLFVFTAMSRVGHSYEYSDLTYYVEYFESDNLVYFEAGYVWLTEIIKKYVGNQGEHLVFVVSIWIVFFITLTVILNKLVDSESFYSLPRKFLNERKMSYFFVVIFIFSTYWGIAYAAEGLRNGLATSMLFCSASLCISGYLLFSFIPIFLAGFFHISAISFIIVPISLFFLKSNLSKNTFKKWFFTLLLFDIIQQSTGFISPTDIFSRITGLNLAVAQRLLVYEDSEVGSYFSTQYVTYHIIGYIMILGPLKEIRYQKSVIIYYIGLTMGMLFQTTAMFMRIQWLFLGMSVFSVYYMIQNHQVKYKSKMLIITLLTIVQSIMLVRYLGCY